MMEEQLMESEEKVKAIASSLRRDVLEPAKKKAFEIVADAEERARLLERKAEEKAVEIEAKAVKRAEEKLKLLESSLNHAKLQAVETLRQTILHEFFRPKLRLLLEKATVSSEIIAQLIRSLALAVAKGGMEQDLTAIVAGSADLPAISLLLGKELIQELRLNAITLGAIKGGVKLQLDRDSMTLDCSDEALFSLLEPYLREEFRKMLFSEKEEER